MIRRLGIMMKEWKVLVLLEYEWRVFRLYRKFVNFLVKKGMRLTSPILCILQNKSDKHGVILTKLKCLYEKQTGKKIVFYKCDEY
jgi:hypothetical protein